MGLCFNQRLASLGNVTLGLFATFGKLLELLGNFCGTFASCLLTFRKLMQIEIAGFGQLLESYFWARINFWPTFGKLSGGCLKVPKR